MTTVGREITIWHADSGKKEFSIEAEDAITRAEFSTDGRGIVATLGDGSVRVFDANDKNELVVLRSSHGAIGELRSSIDGQRATTFVAHGRYGVVQVWDTGHREHAATLNGHRESVNDAQWSVDGAHIATASNDKTARVWEAEGGRMLATLRGHQGEVVSVGFSRDGRRIVTASVDKTARVWGATDGKLIAILRGHGEWVRTAEFSADGSKVVTACGDNTARLWNAETGDELAILSHDDSVSSARFSDDGLRIFTTSVDGEARVWDAVSGQLVRRLPGYGHAGRAGDFSRDGRLVVTTSLQLDRGALVRETATGNVVSSLGRAGRLVSSAVFSEDGAKVMVLNVVERFARVFDVKSGTELFQLRGHHGMVTGGGFSADGEWLLTGSEDGTLRIWDAQSGSVLALFNGHNGGVSVARISPNASRLLVAYRDGTARTFRLDGLVERDIGKRIDGACRRRLMGASRLTDEDVYEAPILRGRVGEDVCAR